MMVLSIKLRAVQAIDSMTKASVEGPKDRSKQRARHIR